MKRRWLGVLTFVPVMACSIVDPEVQATCVAALMYDGVLYGLDDSDTLDSRVPGDVVGAVARNVGCDDTPEPGVTTAPSALASGDSNFLPPATKVHAVIGHSVSEQLAVRPDTVWIFLKSAKSPRLQELGANHTATSSD